MFIVQSGKVVVERESNGKVNELASLGPGEFFGEMALMTGEERTATVRALVPSTLIGVDQDAIKSLLDASSELATVISASIIERQAAVESLRAPESAEPASVEERAERRRRRRCRGSPG